MPKIHAEEKVDSLANVGKISTRRKMKVMEIEFTMLGEISPAQKDKCIMFPVICGV